jgi:hypothetical protein
MFGTRRGSRWILNWMRGNRAHLIAFVTLTAVSFVPLLWMALVLALHTGLFGFSVGRSPTGLELRAFATFIGGGLATAAMIFGALLTAEHNTRERRRLDFDTVLKSLEAIPAGTPQRLAGVLSATVLIGQPRIALRILGPAWQAGEVDAGTATWIIDEIIADGSFKHPYHLDGEIADNTTLIEAASLLLQYSGQLTNPGNKGEYSFPGHFMDTWDAGKGMPQVAKLYVLQAMAEVLLSQRKGWWCYDGVPCDFPMEPWVDCVRKEQGDPIVGSSAAALLVGLCEGLPAQERQRYVDSHDLAPDILRKDLEAFKDVADTECYELAQQIAGKWHRHRGVLRLRPGSRSN